MSAIAERPVRWFSVVGKTVDDDSVPGTFDGTAIAPAVTTAATTGAGSVDLSGALSTAGFAAGDSFSITVGADTRTFTFYDSAAAGTDPSDATTGVVGVDLNGTTGTGADLVSAINGASGFNSTVASLNTAKFLDITAGNLTDSVTIDSGTSTNTLGFAGGVITKDPTSTPITVNSANVLAAKLNGPTSVAAGGVSGISAGDSFTVNGKTVTFASSGGTAINALTGGQIDLSSGTVSDVVSAINTITGGTVASIDATGKLHIDANQAPTGINVDLANTSGSPLAAVGVTGPVSVTNAASATSTTGITAASKLSGAGTSTSTGLASDILNTDSITVGYGGKNYTIAFGGSAGGTTFDSTTSTYTMDLSTATVGDVLNTIDKITGTYGTSSASTISNGQIHLSTGTDAGGLKLSDSTTAAATGNNRGVLAKLGLDDLDAATAGDGVATPVYASSTETLLPSTSAASPVTGATKIAQAAGPTSNGLASGFTTSDSIKVNGKTIAFYNTGAGGSAGTDANTTYLDLASASVQDVVDAIDKVTGTYGTSKASTIDATGAITLHTGTTSDLSISNGGASDTLAKLGLTTGVTKRETDSTLSGLTLNIGATDGGSAVNITFGSGDGEVDTLDELNTQLATDNLEASIDTTGKLTITTTNDHSSASVGTLSGTAITAAGSPLFGLQATGPAKNTDSQNSRAALVSQYNDIIDQIRTTAQDASFNGVNLLNGDQLKLVFNETGTSTLNVKGVTDDPSGLGLSYLTAGTDFLDNASTNKILSSLNSASTTLRSQGSTLGSNLSIVQIRQDFSNNLINVLQTGASNLTLADTNEEAANSQALSTRQSIAVSALSLANQSQQSVLRLLQ